MAHSANRPTCFPGSSCFHSRYWDWCTATWRLSHQDLERFCVCVYISYLRQEVKNKQTNEQNLSLFQLSTYFLLHEPYLDPLVLITRLLSFSVLESPNPQALKLSVKPYAPNPHPRHGLCIPNCCLDSPCAIHSSYQTQPRSAVSEHSSASQSSLPQLIKSIRSWAVMSQHLAQK